MKWSGTEGERLNGGMCVCVCGGGGGGVRKGIKYLSKYCIGGIN